MSSSLLIHKHLIIRAESNKPPQDEADMQLWMLRFIESIKMKPMISPIAVYCNMKGNRGLTAMCIIETSHIAIHCWDEVQPALMQIDIYSCGEFDAEIICKKLIKDFDLSTVEYKFLDRENNLTEIGGGTITHSSSRGVPNSKVNCL